MRFWMCQDDIVEVFFEKYNCVVINSIILINNIQYFIVYKNLQLIY